MWVLNNTRIYVQQHQENMERVIARLQPISSGTILHDFGYSKPIVKISAHVVGLTNKTALMGLITAGGTPPQLSGPYGSVQVRVKSVNFNQVPTVCQSIDTTQATTAPVYIMEAELYRTTIG